MPSRAKAARLSRGRQEVPHFTVKRTALLDELLVLRAQLNAFAPMRLSIDDFVVRAVAAAHIQVPDANVIRTGDGLRRFRRVDVSVAIDSARGMVAPVLRSVEKSSLSTISGSVRAFAARADAGRLRRKDLEGGSITVTNLGRYGVEECVATVRPPQPAVLAVGAAQPVPRVVDDDITVVTTANLVLSVDERAIDGMLAARWMDALIVALENPLSLVV